MNRKFLEELGLEKEAIDKIMEKNGQGIEQHKADIAEVEKQRDSYKEQLEAFQGKVESLEDVDVEALRGEITQLQKDLDDNKVEYQRSLASKDFEALLTNQLLTAKALYRYIFAFSFDIAQWFLIGYNYIKRDICHPFSKNHAKTVPSK